MIRLTVTEAQRSRTRSPVSTSMPASSSDIIRAGVSKSAFRRHDHSDNSEHRRQSLSTTSINCTLPVSSPSKLRVAALALGCGSLSTCAPSSSSSGTELLFE